MYYKMSLYNRPVLKYFSKVGNSLIYQPILLLKYVYKVINGIYQEVNFIRYISFNVTMAQNPFQGFTSSQYNSDN